MKKALCIILSLMMVLVCFTACGDNNEPEYVTDVNGETVTDAQGAPVTVPPTKKGETTTTTSTTLPPAGSQGSLEDLGNFDPNASEEDLLDEGTETSKTTLRDDIITEIVSDKKFTISMTVIGNGTEIPTTVTMDGEKFAASLSMSGIDAKVINQDGKTYMAFNYMGMKMYMETDEDTTGMGDLMAPSADADQVYVKTTTVEDGDKTYTCEEYKNSDGVVTKYYFEGQKWVRQEVIDGETISICEITEIKNTVDNSLFSLAGYTKLDESTLGSLGM